MIIKKIQFGEHELILQTGEIARQAHGSVFVSMFGTQVLVTVVSKPNVDPYIDFFPLTVNYQEKSYAAGKIPGGFNKREGRPSEHETLISRLIDRPIRPLFPKNFHHEVQVIATVVSLNPEVPADILALIGASAALAISGLPFHGPIGAVRVGYQDGIYLLNPGHQIVQRSKLDLVIAGTEDAILMVESAASELSEEIMLGAILYGHEMMKPVIQSIKEMAHEAGKPALVWTEPQVNETWVARLAEMGEDAITKAYLIKDKQERHDTLLKVRLQLSEKMLSEFGANESGQESDNESSQELLNPELSDKFLNKTGFFQLLDELEQQIVRERILNGEPRIDGRDCKTVRPIVIRTNILDRVHGSVLFTRGETQALVAVTLGSERDAQTLDRLEGEVKERFMLHYNFPPYSVGETGMFGSPKRREIGHGRLARRGLMAVLPEMRSFPYVIRVVSDITESNGSSSMATVCGASLALMDAGVPIKNSVAGVAMGLIKEGNRWAVLTDILGDEDHLGDMDFKVAGTDRGITALQMDIKIKGITKEIMEEALEQALAGRLHILNIMKNALAEHREELSVHAPRIITMKIPEDKIRTVIGKGGSTVKGIIESTGVSIDIDDSGIMQIFSPNTDALSNAQQQIRALIAEIEVGQTYHGKVTKIVDFGAFINLLPGKDGLLHISQICADRSQKVQDVLQEGQEIEVYVAGVDRQGRVKLEWKDKPGSQKEEKQPNQTEQDMTVPESAVSETVEPSDETE